MHLLHQQTTANTHAVKKLQNLLKVASNVRSIHLRTSIGFKCGTEVLQSQEVIAVFRLYAEHGQELIHILHGRTQADNKLCIVNVHVSWLTSITWYLVLKARTSKQPR